MTKQAGKMKARAPAAGSYKASAEVALAIRELAKTKQKQAILRRRAAFLCKRIEAGGCGSAHGYRTYIAHENASRRIVVTKERYYVKMVPATASSRKRTA